MNQEPLNRDDDFDVFQYVAGAMSVDAETQFEKQLQHDQALREKVAGMVSTLAAVDKVFADSAVTPASKIQAPKTNKRSTFRIFASLAAVVLLAALAITLIPDQGSDDSESIAIAWAESVGTVEFELPEQMDELVYATIDFESDRDWIFDVVATQEDSASLN